MASIFKTTAITTAPFKIPFIGNHFNEAVAVWKTDGTLLLRFLAWTADEGEVIGIRDPRHAHENVVTLSKYGTAFAHDLMRAGVLAPIDDTDMMRVLI